MLKTKKLVHFASIFTGFPFKGEKYKNAGIRVVRGENVTEGALRWDMIKCWNEVFEQIETYSLISDDIVIGMDGSKVGKNIARIKPKDLPLLLAQRVACIRAKNDNSQGFLYYNLYNPRFIDYVFKTQTGSSVPHISKKQIEDFEIPDFDSLTQTQIAKVLSDLDAKIELNNRINAELEAMAKTIYDYWFVQFEFPFDFAQDKPKADIRPYKSSGGKMVWNEELKREIPEGWEVNCLGNLGNFKNGVNYDPSNPGEIACPIINVRNISASRYFLKNEDLDIIYLREADVRKYSVHEGSIIIARSGIPGATRLISDMANNTLYCGFAIHYELENLDFKIPVFFYLKSIEQQIQSGSGGTILKNVNQATLNDLKIILPKSDKIISEFNLRINPIFGKINLIQKQNQKLAELRDWLLPMLMNGQVRIEKLSQND
jgi:type I restriction enzyme S subunit